MTRFVWFNMLSQITGPRADIFTNITLNHDKFSLSYAGNSTRILTIYKHIETQPVHPLEIIID